MNKAEILSKAERSFSPKVTKQQLMSEPMLVGSWGAHNWKNISDKAFLFEVNGALHKGNVLITLGYEDLYKVYLLDEDFKFLETSEHSVYAEDLVWTIDAIVETPQ
jgi:hypothetical protein